ncbi:MAG: hypothetical protein A2812_01915 [Candidatus Staskawiczbacteria bacterium RIFCSPHIGHO2_01_FULL_36_16]|uniref:Uncharacterized protein n=1 Tax=Candidatus Staskawiczbacteria bacterium RIFCSPHIGHO2_01_FULL_36_16 TaxID=1802200 RepID=A0A1G2HRE2_9BACT|nr:MAG: hypothetical protein A2812_01915 [Candidatus Staskawiczbacteria bacterium RIFCSPHIGHO2_01_FULL_36_16]
MAKKNMTINDLAVMVQKGFEKTSTKEQVENLESRIENLEFRINKIEKDVAIIKGTVKNLVAENYKKRIEKLEDELKEIKGTLALILK